MVLDALDGKMELIITKSVSRFALNTVDLLITIRLLKDRGVEDFIGRRISTLDSLGAAIYEVTLKRRTSSNGTQIEGN
jgi:hypothetical protein